MSATIEKSLCIGLTKTRFDLGDTVHIKCKRGGEFKGEIIDFDNNEFVILKDKEGKEWRVDVDSIDTYIPE